MGTEAGQLRGQAQAMRQQLEKATQKRNEKESTMSTPTQILDRTRIEAGFGLLELDKVLRARAEFSQIGADKRIV